MSPSPIMLPRILIVDHHDSYTLNLLSILLPPQAFSSDQHHPDPLDLSQALSERVFVLPHTHPLLQPANFAQHVRPHIDAIILSPGPGIPEKPADFGAAEALLRDDDLGIPVLGVCLGHQGLATAFGSKVVRARSVRHGLKSALSLEKAEDAGDAKRPHLLQGVAQGTHVIRYNSLTVDSATLPDCLRVTAWGFDEPCQAPLPHTRSRNDLVRSCLQHSLRAPQSGCTTPRYSDQLASSRRSSPTEAIMRLKSRIVRVGSSDSSSLGELEEDLVDPSADDLDRVILALEHKTRPLYGVQFHPESIESSAGRQMMHNFLAIVRAYWSERAGARAAVDSADHAARADAPDGKAKLPDHLRTAGVRCVASGKASTAQSVPEPGPSAPQKACRIASTRIDVPNFDCERVAPELFRRLFQHRSEVGAVWLDSARRKDPHSRFSYMAVPIFALFYSASSRQLRLLTSRNIAHSVAVQMDAPIADGAGIGQTTFWEFMDELQGALKATTNVGNDCLLPSEAAGSVFRTGFVGYFGYEMKGESLGLDSPVPPPEKEGRPDCEFLFCNRVLAFDHHLRQWTAFALTGADLADGSSTSAQPWPISVIENALQQQHDGAKAALAVSETEAQHWFEEVSQALREMPAVADVFRPPTPHSIKDALPPLQPRLTADEYMNRIELSREQILAGESYELCLTTQFCGTMPPLPLLKDASSTIDEDELDHFGLYCKLRARNPAPYSAFLRLPSHDVDGEGAPPQRGRSIVCTSPERFMRITRDGEVEMKPIKGTLARAGYGQDEEGMRAGDASPEEEEEKLRWREAGDARRRQRLAADAKERAENLMIVDLIRADLLSFCHAHSVVVPTLMSVETYETVHQLVTTVRGQLKGGVGTVEAIRRCFPPGSMTGAPKRRSVQLLETLERKRIPSSGSEEKGARRGIYSGALGWMGVDGAADFAVVIRTLVADGNQISIGAGGAITYLSDPAKEWGEVLDKLRALANVEV